MLYDMRQVIVDTLNMRVFGSDKFKGNPKTPSNIHKCLDVLKTLVRFKSLLYDQGGMVDHCCVKNLVKP